MSQLHEPLLQVPCLEKAQSQGPKLVCESNQILRIFNVTQFFHTRHPEALEMDLSQEGPDQNFEFSLNAGNQILRTFAFIQLFDPRLP